MVNAQPNNPTLEHTDGSPNFGQKTRTYNNQQQKKKKRKEKLQIVPSDHRIKLKESEKKNKYLYLAREWKNYGT